MNPARATPRESLFEGVLTPPRIFLLALAILLATHSDVLADPPYWDAILGAFPQAHWLARNGLSPWKLLTEARPYLEGGACIYPFSVYPWIVAALEDLGLARGTSFVVLHLASFVCAAFVVAFTFRLACAAFGIGLAALVAAALFCVPLFQALACQINMDMPLTACTLGALVALREGRVRTCTVWSALALAVKPTGVITVVACLTALGLRTLRPQVFGLGDRERGAARSGAIVHVVLLLVFVGEIALTAGLGKSAPGMTFLGGFVPLFAKRLWTLPEYGVALVLFLATIPWLVLRAARGRASATEIDLATFLVLFVLVFGQYDNVLPRYFLQSWPVLLVALAAWASRAGIPGRAIGTALALFALYGLANTHGRFHPTKLAEWSDPADPRPLVANDGWLLERSMEYRDGLTLDRELARRLSARKGAIVVAHWPLVHVLLVPEFGYVDEPPSVATTGTPIDFGAPMVALENAPEERRIWALTPNVFCGPEARILPGDSVIETIEAGRLRAFLVKRPEQR